MDVQTFNVQRSTYAQLVYVIPAPWLLEFDIRTKICSSHETATHSRHSPKHASGLAHSILYLIARYNLKTHFQF